MEESKHIVISLGGSLIVPDEIDTDFLKIFVETINEYVEKGFKFSIITGGGKIARRYNVATEKLVTPSKSDLDWMGIAATRLNAELVRIAFGENAHDVIILDPDNISKIEKPVTVGGGWKPGNSSDLAAIHTANSVGSKKVINLSNIEYAYDKDPKVFPDAKVIKESSWSDFRAILPKEWEPGLSTPFDPIASARAEELGIEVAIMNGKNIQNFKKYLNGEEFIGSVIK